MGSGSYPFIDIAVLDPVRGRFAAGEALLLLTVDLDSVLWANAPGAGLLGAHDLIAAVGMESGLSATAIRQIKSAAAYHQKGRCSQLVARIGGRPESLVVERIDLPGGQAGILLSAAEPQGSEDDAARRAIAGFAESGQYLAIVDHEATVRAATAGFDALGFSLHALAELVAEVRTERDRLVKRRLQVGGRVLPVGFGRLTDSPALHLLVTVDDGPDEVEEAPVVQSRATAEAIAPPAAPKGGPGRAIRFLWRTDDEGRLNAVSDEFLDAAKLSAESLVGKTFRELASELGIDRDGAIAALLERRDTWSGRTVLWPIGGQSVPVDLAALPAYSRDRTFEGFRGFGVARFGDVQPLQTTVEEQIHAETEEGPEADHVVEPAQPDATDSDTSSPRYEPPVLQSAVTTPAPPTDDKIIQLAERRGGGDRALSQAERSAFREIGDRLRADEGEVPSPFGKRTIEPEARAAVDEPVSEFVPESTPANDDAPRAETQEQPEALEADDIDSVADEQDIADLERLDAEGETDLQPAEAATADTSIVERLPVPVLIHSGDDLHYANPEFLSLTGYPALEHLQEAGGIDALFADELDDGYDGAERQLRLRRKDGVEFPIEALLRSVKWRAGNALMLVVRVAGDEPGEDPPALAEARVRIAELRTILDTATDGVIMIDADGSIRSLSSPAEALFGFDSDDLAGKPFTSLFAIESQATAREYLTSLSDHGVASLLNDGREVIGREAQGRFIPLFMTIGRMPNNSGYCAVLRDVTHWKRAEEELSQSRRQAERASSQKTDFLARVSHEIRTPLNAIIGFSELMLDEKFGPISNDRYRDYLRDINRSGNHVLDLVNDLLDITKIEAGEQEMSYEAISLNDTLAEAVAIMQPQANRERVIIRSSFATRLPQVVADLRSVRQIALNVLSNAVRYTQAGGQVIISTAYEASGDIVMRVRDTGIGMTQNEIEQALKPFKQINSLNRTRGDGTGLGLPLTKAMVEANRARFVITSAPNEGTLVEVVFPSTRVLAQ
jgi:PAS domain S-box-containing protein